MQLPPFSIRDGSINVNRFHLLLKKWNVGSMATSKVSRRSCSDSFSNGGSMRLRHARQVRWNPSMYVRLSFSIIRETHRGKKGLCIRQGLQKLETIKGAGIGSVLWPMWNATSHYDIRLAWWRSGVASGHRRLIGTPSCSGNLRHHGIITGETKAYSRHLRFQIRPNSFLSYASDVAEHLLAPSSGSLSGWWSYHSL